MAEPPDTNRIDAAHDPSDMANASEIKLWFVREVLPLEGVLIQFLNRSGRSKSDVEDLRQEVYMRVCAAAQDELPCHAKALVFTAARNLLIDRVRREQIVSIEFMENLDVLNIAIEEPALDRVLIAREELRKLQAALDKLPERERAVLVMQKIEGLSVCEIAERLGVSTRTVKRSLSEGFRALADLMLREPADPRRTS
jgi:RNA polymerase sigma factor (sigma-70 family)